MFSEPIRVTYQFSFVSTVQGTELQEKSAKTSEIIH